MVADYTTRSIDDIEQMGQRVMEAAYDLRAYELLGQFIEPGDVDGSEDTRYDFYRAKMAAQPMAGYGPIELVGDSNIQRDSINAVSVEDYTDVRYSNLGHEFDWIPAVFSRYTCGDSGAYSAVDAACEAAANAHCSNVGLYETTEDLDVAKGTFDAAADIEKSITNDASGAQLGSWSGEFADQLSDKVVTHISDISANHVHMLRAVQGATRLHWALVAAARESIHSIGQATLDKLNAALGKQQDANEHSEFADAVVPMAQALVLAAGVVVTAATGGAAAALTISILVATGSATSAGIKLKDAIDTDSIDLTGSSVDEIVTSMNTGIEELNSRIESEERVLAKAIADLNTDISILTTGSTKKDWEAFRPAAADYSTSDDETVYGPDGDKYEEMHHEFG